MIVPLHGSETERRRTAEIDRLREMRAVDALVDRLADPSWVVRRSVVSALALLGDSAVEPLCDVLRMRRDDEARLAAAVDALVASLGDVDPVILKLADSESPSVVCDSVQILGRRRAAMAMPKLAALAASEDDNVAMAAFEAVGRIGGESAIDLLLSAVESGNFFRAFPAIDVLGRTGDARAIAPLCALLSVPHYAIEAVRALGRSAQPGAVPALVPLLVKPNDTQVRVVATALVEIHERHAQRYGPSRVVLDGLAAVDASAATRRLAQALAGADAAERSALCTVMGWLGGMNAVFELVELLDAEPAVGKAAADAIGALDSQAEPFLIAALRRSHSERRLLLLPILARRGAATPEISECLGDDDPGVRAAACDALGKSGDPTAIPLLFHALADPDARVSQAAVSAIQSLGGVETERLALESVRLNDPRVQRSALRILAYFGWASGLELFLEAVQAPDDRLRDLAALGLASIGDDRAVAALIHAAAHRSSRTRSAAVRALGQTRNLPEICDCVRAALADADSWVRYYACQSLGRLEDEDSAEAIRVLLADPAGHVRVAAIEALARLGGKRALDALHAAAESPDADLQRAALLGIGTARDRASVPLLLRGLASREAATRLVALSALAEFDDADALAGIRAAMKDSDENVQGAAISLLSGRRGAEAAQALIEAMQNPALRERVLIALSSPVEGRIEALVRALQVGANETIPDIAAALVRMRRAEASAAVEDAFRSGEALTRRALAPSLAALQTPVAQHLLVSAAADDPDPQVRGVCAALLLG